MKKRYEKLVHKLSAVVLSADGRHKQATARFMTLVTDELDKERFSHSKNVRNTIHIGLAQARRDFNKKFGKFKRIEEAVRL